MGDGGYKETEGKAKWQYVDMSLLEETLVRVREYGTNKYQGDSEGWKRVPNAEVEYRDAIKRHSARLDAGEIYDAESGLPHSAHIQCNSYFLSWFERERGKEK